MRAIDTSRTAIDRPFGGAERRFQLRLGEIGELERLCGAGIGAIMVRLGAHQFYARDIVETIRLGLEGGGRTNEVEAMALMRRYVVDRPLAHHVQLAAEILSAAVAGVEMPDADDPPGKETAEGSTDPATSPSIFAPAGPPA